MNGLKRALRNKRMYAKKFAEDRTAEHLELKTEEVTKYSHTRA